MAPPAAIDVLLISTYELGRQPFGLASPAAWLRDAGAMVTCLDLAVQPLDAAAVAAADLVAFYVPMHTATRLTAPLLARIKALNPRARVCCYGLYAPLNAGYLRGLGADTILGGEFEEGLVSLVERLSSLLGAPASSRQVVDGDAIGHGERRERDQGSQDSQRTDAGAPIGNYQGRPGEPLISLGKQR
ncbi:MAG: hypothetical protein M3Y74_09755, partial [Chloroflexota bacterium]|nr:hypothetical protein [Chloroflexota bacterium]